jgi:hypothetical protein
VLPTFDADTQPQARERGASADVRASVYESLKAYGAPLADWEGCRTLTLEDALAQGLRLAHQDSTLLRTLPVVLARHALRLNSAQLTARARELGCEAELGMLLELTAKLTGNQRLGALARTLEHARAAEPRFFFEPRGPFERKYTPLRTPEVARRWGFFLDMPPDVFGTLLAKHCAQVQL